MLGLLVVFNFLISSFNAWAVGKSWAESKHAGGFAHFMNWMGLVMSACGFTWCYLVVICTVGTHWDVTDKDTGLVHPFLDPEVASIVFKLGYVAIILPIIGSGTAITVQSWAHFYRNRTWANGGVASYNTFADMYNIYQAASHVPNFLSDIGKFFEGGDGKDKATRLVIFLVVVSIVGGMLTTYIIFTHSAQMHLFNMKMKAEGLRVDRELQRAAR